MSLPHVRAGLLVALAAQALWISDKLLAVLRCVLRAEAAVCRICVVDAIRSADKIRRRYNRSDSA